MANFLIGNKYKYLIIVSTLIYLLGFYFSYSNSFDLIAKEQNISGLRNLVEYGFMYLSFLFFCSFFYKNKFSRILVFILLLFISINFLISVICFGVYHTPFNSGMTLSIIDTNVAEATSMASTFVFPIIISILFFIFNIYTVKTIAKTSYSKYLIIFSFVWLLFPFLYKLKHTFISNKGGGNMIKSVYYHYNDFASGMSLRNDLLNVKKNKIIYTTKKTEEGINTIVLLIGESVVPSRMQLYDYLIKNTPNQVKEKENMQFYKNAVSPAGITNLSVPLMLSTIKPEEFITNKQKLSDNIINFSNYTGYNTYWLSTQSLSGSISFISSYAKNRKYIAGYDDSVIPEFNKILKDRGKKLIVLHLIGSHPNPCDKIPKSEKKDSKNISECYDNSIQYTDKIIAKLMNGLRNENAVFIYASDHSLKIKKSEYIHSDSKESTKVPFYIWFSNNVNSKYKKTETISELTQTTIIYPKIVEFMGYESIKNYKNKDLKYLNLQLKTIDYSSLKD